MATSRSGKHRSEPDPLAERIGQRIRALRKASGISFDAFVGETGLGRGYVSELERGLVVPSVTTLDRVATALGMTMADLVIGDTARERLFEATRELTERQCAQVLHEVQVAQKGRAKRA
jgi:transcriptional regulator with XRE-family HTH domain